jgi:proteasome alpha subunit
MAFGGVPPHQAAYDRATTIFSPEGDLYQVRYAFEAVKKGWTSLGLKTAEFVVLAAEKKLVTKLMELSDIEKIYKVDDHVGVAFAGMGGDGRILIDYARIVAVRHRLLYGEPASVELLAKAIADIKQAYTQHGGVRPFGVGLIFGGINPDGTPKLYRTDPGGQYFSFKAIAIGSGDQEANEYFEKHYREDLTFDEAISMVLKVLFASLTKGVESSAERKRIAENLHIYVEIGYADSKTKTFKKMQPGDLKAYVDKVRSDLLSRR